MERVMHDGVKIEAWGSDKSFRCQKTLERHLESALQVVEKMEEADSEEVSERVAKARERAVRERKGRLEAALKELKPMQAAQSDPEKQLKARESTSNPEIRIMQQPGGGFAPSYNVQISTDAKAAVIMGLGGS